MLGWCLIRKNRLANFLLRYHPGASQYGMRSAHLNWVIPHFEPGSGGHLNIFRLIAWLQRLGYRNHIVLLPPTHYNARQAKFSIRHHFEPIKASVAIGELALQPAKFTIATGWQTADAVRDFTATEHKLYFVQDFEPWFYPRGSEYLMAEATYRFGFSAITVGPWLAERMRSYGMPAYPVGLACDHRYYRPSYVRRRRRVFFYARSVTPRRGFELGLLALRQFHQAMPGVEIVLAGWDTRNQSIPFRHTSFGHLPLRRLARCYSRCQVALVISLTNVSLLPLELMACGCTVVSNRGPNVEWLLHDGDNALLADATPDALAEALQRLLQDDELRQRLQQRGLVYARATSWQAEAHTWHQHLQAIAGEDHDRTL